MSKVYNVNMFCLPKELTNVFLEKVKSGEINPEKLTEMTSEERRAFFTGFLGEENAKRTNAFFESKLLLKNQQEGIINWAKNIAGLKPEIQRDILSKVQRMTEVLQPKEMNSFLGDLASQRLGIGITMEEAGKIADLAKKVADKKTEVGNGGDRLEYGRARVDFSKYVNDLKFKDNPLSLKEKIKGSISEIGGTSKSLKASLDNSAIFRQGWKTLFTHPEIWFRNAKQSFADIWKTFGKKAVMDELNADIVSRPNYDLMRKAKLAIGNIEESYPSTLPERVPFLGRAYKASENAFTAFVQRTRADVFDKYIETAQKAGVDVTDKVQLENIGKLVNSLTGRGYLGRLEPSANVVNNLFFSPRFLKSHLDVLTAHLAQKDVTPFVRKQAAINLLKIVGGTATILGVANAVKPGSVELDPRSADFGKIKIRDTRFDVSGGMASILTLAARLATWSSKSSTTGKITQLNSGKYGSQTAMDILLNFSESKLSPVASIIKDVLKGQDFQGKKPRVLGEANNLLTPLPITNFMELKNDPNSANILLAMIADALGIGTNTYSNNKSSGVRVIKR